MIPKSHIRTIVNKLRRRVNQSGKEPCWRLKTCYRVRESQDADLCNTKMGIVGTQ
jgi:hypothetical protein